MKIRGSEEFVRTCQEAVFNYYTENELTEPKEVYCVWYCKELQNQKGLFSTDIPDTRYFEFTYNGDKEELYLDAYVKEKNECLR